MQWLLQDFEDNHKLARALDHLGIRYSWHKVIPFVGDLIPEPDLNHASNTVMFGSYALWKYAARHSMTPGIFRVSPFVQEEAWKAYMLNGADAVFVQLSDIPEKLQDNDRLWFIRPIEDNKEIPGGVRSSNEIIALAKRVLTLEKDEIPIGSLRHDTELMLTQPAHILQEWRLWAVEGKIITWSLYKDGARVIYRHEIDADALEFAQMLVDANPGYALAYVIDVCRTADGLRMLETNCMNAAGFYEADLVKLAKAIDGINSDQC
ncbi:ATP-grasp domain-containing protein [Halocynthiibacter sp.]|uniref:ATP-grasp domain-containing protein n=1 Tax=Halocynthiibacter sp. TaxID=1979210 RepID=UPI003C30FDE7